MSSRRILLSIALLLAAVTAFAMTSNRIVLRVNDRISTLYDYELRLNERLRAIQQADLDPTRRAELVDQAGEEVLGNLLEELLVLSRADQIGYRPSDEELDAAIERTRESFGIQTEEQFEAALATSGMTREDFRRQVAVNMRVSNVMAREVQQRVELTEEDLRRYYYDHPDQFTTPERRRLAEVVVLESSELEPAARRELALELRGEIAAGRPIAEVVEAHGAAGSTSDVVELGWVERGDLDPTLEEAVWELEAGAVSEPVEGRGGLHVIEVLEREEAALLPFNQVADEIDRIERERLMRQEYAAYLDELRDAAYIRIHYLPAGAEDFDVEESASRLRLEGGSAGRLTVPAEDSAAEGASEEPPATEPSQTEPPQTETPQNEPPQTETPQTEPLEGRQP